MSDIKNGQFYVAVGAVIVDSENRVLLTQRSFERDHHPGEWEIMTGRLAQGEGFGEALVREAMEELNIRLTVLTILNTFHFFRGPERIEHVGVSFLCRYASGEIKVDGVEEIAYVWLNIDDAISRVNDLSIKDNLRRAKKFLDGEKNGEK